ncbi:putative Bax inhibitor 1 [Tetrabaena socialis]|uniref:Putative Bax inhibitor 1 n=1 Tax=Tetrabaena socialis TaxID=47790 RepID=A0A2J7ZZ24_9CHLO|nr:putative Bax inhibitor 1 [Tetrabaena socialis]|eukprot:PNH05517.1 putative Bax inhibitor 1 [Tetrabaena socialis]
MDAVERLVGRRFDGVNLGTLMKFSHLDRPVQAHLQKVYATLTAALVVSALGCYADMQLGFAGILTFLAGFGCLAGLAMTASTPATLNTRYALLAGFSFCQGAALGKLVGMAVAINSSLVLTAFLGTSAIFCSFTLASLLSARRSFLFLGGWLASAVTCLFVVRMSSWLVGARSLGFSVELYGGLLMFSLYVLLDTQVIVEKAAMGYTDHVKAALDLLVDVLAIFARVLIILMKNQAKKAERESRRRDNKRSD